MTDTARTIRDVMEEIRAIATDINAQHDSAKDATDCLLSYVKKNRRARNYVLWYGCNRLIHDDRHQARTGRPVNANTTTTVPRSGRDAQLTVSASYTTSLLNSYFVGDKRLGDCTKEDLINQIQTHEGSIRGFQFEIAFLSKVVKKLPNKTVIVREVLNEQKVVKLREG